MDGSGRAQLPTLDHVRANYLIMSGGQELPDDAIQSSNGSSSPLLGHHFVAGDGRVDGPVSGMFTVWHRNHNQWVDRLKAETHGAWTENAYFEAARIINVAEYQRVVFTEFADAISQSTGHSHPSIDGYESNGAAGYDASQLSILPFLPSEKFSFVDKVTGETKQVSLADTILGQGNGHAAQRS